MESGHRNPAGWVIYRIYIPTIPTRLREESRCRRSLRVTADGNVQIPLGACTNEPPRAGDEIDRGIAESNYPLEGERHVPGTYRPAGVEMILRNRPRVPRLVW